MLQFCSKTVSKLKFFTPLDIISSQNFQDYVVAAKGLWRKGMIGLGQVRRDDVFRCSLFWRNSSSHNRSPIPSLSPIFFLSPAGAKRNIVSPNREREPTIKPNLLQARCTLQKVVIDPVFTRIWQRVATLPYHNCKVRHRRSLSSHLNGIYICQSSLPPREF